MGQGAKRDAEKRALIRKTVRICGEAGVSTTERSVERIISGEQKNEYVLGVYMEVFEGVKGLENDLVAAAKQMVPFN